MPATRSATHSQSHPSGMHRLSIERAKAEIDDGIAQRHRSARRRRRGGLSPFFRIPGLLRATTPSRSTRARGTADLERGFPGRRLAPRLLGAGLRPCAVAARRQGQGHPAAARHPGAHRGGAAENPARAEGPRLSHRPRRAGDAGPAGDAERAAAMADASVCRGRGGAALAENSELRVRAARAAARAAAHRFLLERSGRARRAATRRRGVPLPQPALWPKQVELASIDTASALPAPSAALFDPVEGMRASPPVTAAVVHREEPPVAAQAKAERPAKRLAGRHTRLARVARSRRRSARSPTRVKPSRVAPPVAATHRHQAGGARQEERQARRPPQSGSKPLIGPCRIALQARASRTRALSW